MHAFNLAKPYEYEAPVVPTYAAKEWATIATSFLGTAALIGLFFWAVH